MCTLIDLPGGRERFQLPFPGELIGVESMCFSSNSQRLLTTAFVRTEKERLVVATLWDVETGEQLFDKREPLNDHAFFGTQATLTPDGTKIAWCINLGSFDDNNRLDIDKYVTQLTGWDVLTSKQLGRAEMQKHGDGFVVATGDNNSVFTCGPDGELKVWDFVTGKFTRTFDVKLETRRLILPVMSPDGKTFAVHEPERLIGEDRLEPARIVLYDWSSGKRIRESRDKNFVESLCFAFSPDGKQLVTGHRDCTALIWEVASLNPAK